MFTRVRDKGSRYYVFIKKQVMAVLFDQFSYRMNKTSEGVYYDRWHGHMFPEISIPEKLYFLNRIISALLTHDKLFIRTDSIDEMIECIGFDAFRMLYNRGELVILDNWWVPAFMYDGDTVLYMNLHEKQYQDKICSRLFNSSLKFEIKAKQFYAASQRVL